MFARILFPEGGGLIEESDLIMDLRIVGFGGSEEDIAEWNL